jgi:ketosteroid isomerase-like protein
VTVRPEDQVLDAAARLVAAFGRHDVGAYFASFAPDATFLFYTTHERLPSREAYRTLWARWEGEDGFRVLSCVSKSPSVQLVTDAVAVFTHDVVTRQRLGDQELEIRERETIVFRREPDGRWLGVHEHLSPAP